MIWDYKHIKVDAKKLSNKVKSRVVQTVSC